MRVGVLQQNYVIGDCAGNARRILEGYQTLCNQGAELVVSSELSFLGYPPKDLLEHNSKINEQLSVFNMVRQQVGDVGLIVGLAEWNTGEGKSLFNNAVFIHKGSVIGKKSKELLPDYDVFDERRYFQPGPRQPKTVLYRGKRIGLIVCEDAWGTTENPKGKKLYTTNPVSDMVPANADLLVIINASPYYWGKGMIRHKLVSEIAQKVDCPVVYVNQVGGNDELVFDGRSFGVDAKGRCIGCLMAFEEEVSILDTETLMSHGYPFDQGQPGDLYRALVLGTRDYLLKTGYTKVVVGESGGIDSALVTCIATDAVGAENVTAIGMPSDFSSEGSVEDARKLCQKLGVRFEVIPIGTLYDTFGFAVQPVIGWQHPDDFGDDVTEENVQARLRGAILMAYSNRNGALVLSTGNKSELYGDMVGGLAVISDVPKTQVYGLVKYINAVRGEEIIPLSIINKAPSAELRPGQKDQDSLPDYDTLDRILKSHLEEGCDIEEIIKKGLRKEDVESILSKVYRNEYKRRQAALGLKVTTKAFGSGRRYPIATKPR
jgi:NAD+ synthase (glutamine-hydrolysing)